MHSIICLDVGRDAVMNFPGIDNTSATFYGDVLQVGTAPVSINNPSVMTMIYWIPYTLRGSSARIFIATISSKLLARKNCISPFSFGVEQFCAHVVRFLTVCIPRLPCVARRTSFIWSCTFRVNQGGPRFQGAVSDKKVFSKSLRYKALKGGIDGCHSNDQSVLTS